MTDDNSNLVDMDNLNDFEDVFYGRKEAPVAPEEPKVKDEVEGNGVDETESDQLETSEDTDASQEDDEQPEEASEKEEVPQKRPRKSAKERIDELTAEKYELRRYFESEVAQLRQALEATRKPEATEAPAKTPQNALEGAPSPDAVDKDGNPVYPMGELDPQFHVDLTRFTIAREIEARNQQAAQQEHLRRVTEAQNALKQSWETKLQAAEKESPEIREDIQDLVGVLGNINPQYGEYLAMTVMQCENGPAILQYLSQNIGEAQKIVASGPNAATLAIGRLDDRFARARQSEEKRNKIVSEAPAPIAPVRGRGASTKVRDDTDDLDAFSKEFFKRR